MTDLLSCVYTEIKLIEQDLESREISLQKREQRISEDRELVEQRFAALSEDLHQTREELVTFYYNRNYITYYEACICDRNIFTHTFSSIK